MGMMEPAAPRYRTMGGVRADASSADLKKLADDLAKNFNDFKAANDQRLDELAKGQGDVVRTEQVDRINAAITEIQTRMAAAAQAAAERIDALELQASRLNAGGTGAGDARDFTAEATQFFAGMHGVTDPRVDAGLVEQYQAYEGTFADAMRQWSPRNPAANLMAAMQVGSDPDGGLWVPTQMSNAIKKRLYETSPMRQVADVVTITTDSIGWPTDTDEADSGGFVGETEARTETGTPQIGEQVIYAREQFAQPKVTQKLLDMSTIDVEAWLRNKISEKLARVENNRFVVGTGVKAPRGFLDYRSAAVTTADSGRAWGVLQYIITGQSAGFPTISGIAGAADANCLIDMVAALKPAYRNGARWAMNRATEATIRKLRDADGRYLIGMGTLSEGITGFLLMGYPITDMEDMPDIGSDSFSAAFGNFQTGYQIVDGRGIRILRDPYTEKPYVKFYTTKWTGGDVVNFDAIKLLKFGTS